jgi:DNA-directed RNA polymerase specialized sigma subunit|tara:strand:+ start:1323 stop:1622 length:300 start_codon:yes stop_codon:yes gene_type:complete
MSGEEEGEAPENLTAIDLMLAMAQVENRAMHRLFGGRRTKISQPIDRNKKLKLTTKARMVNRMLQMDMTDTQIANVLDTTRQSVSQIRSRYDLPRKSEL